MERLAGPHGQHAPPNWGWSDPWARQGATTAVPSPGTPAVPSPGTPAPGPFKLDFRKWESRTWAALDLAVKPEGYGSWCNRARRWLSGGTPAIEKLLDLVQREANVLTAEREAALVREAGVLFPLEEVNAATA